MLELWRLAAFLAQGVPVPTPSGDAAPWIGAGISSGLMTWLWWTERHDRKEAERLLLTVYKESAERLTGGLATLDKAIDFFERTEARQERRGR